MKKKGVIKKKLLTVIENGMKRQKEITFQIAIEASVNPYQNKVKDEKPQ